MTIIEFQKGGKMKSYDLWYKKDTLNNSICWKITAKNAAEAKAKMRQLLGVARLPKGTVVVNR